MVALLPEDEPEPFDVVLVELSVAAVGPSRGEQPLRLQEADLRHRDVGELVTEQVDDLADRERPAVRHLRAPR